MITEQTNNYKFNFNFNFNFFIFIFIFTFNFKITNFIKYRHLYNNKITTIPDEFWNLRSLTYL